MARINKNLSKGLLVHSFAGLVVFWLLLASPGGGGIACAGQLLFDGVPVDITTTTNEDLVIAPGTSGNTQIGDATGTNTNATSNDDLHITGILETDGAAYLNSATTLGDSTSDTITVTGYLGSHFIPAADSTYDFGSSSLAWRYLYVDIISGYNAALALNPASGYSLTGSVTKSAATGNEVAYDLAATINKATSGNYTGLQLNVTQTSAPGADDRLLDLQVASVSMFRVDNAGNVTAAGTISGGAFDLTGTTANTFTINNDGTAATSELALGIAGTTGGKISTGAGNLVIDSSGGTIDIDDGTIDLSTQTVDVTLNAAADALNFDSNTLSIDAATNRVGIGTITPQAEFDVNGDILIRKQKSIAITTDAATSDFNHSIYFDQDNNVMNFKEWTTFKWTNTSPAADVEIMTLTPTTGLNVLNDDASNNTVTDILTIQHSSTAAVAAGIGTGLSFQVEDAGGLEEQASIDTVLTTVTEAAENADMVFKVNQAGTISELMKLDAANDRVSVSGDLTITGAFTPATIGAFTAAGTIDMNTNIITNIGNGGTDFVAATGALNLADDLTLAAGADLTMSSGAGLYSQTYTGTATPMTLTANSMTTGSGISITANGLSTGNGISISSTSTAADAYKLVNLSSSGAAAAGKDRYGVYSSLTGTGTGINYAGYFTASGATTNYAIYATGNPSADVANVYSENTGSDGTAGTFVSTATGAGSGAKGIYVRNDGRDDVAAHIETNNANATAQTLYITNNSTQTPDVVSIVPTGAATGGNALVITNTSATNDARGIYLRNDGDGAVGAHVEINNIANASQVIWCITNGTGYAADFIRNNATTNATHTAVELKHTVSTGGTGGADGIGVGLVFTDETSTDGTEHAAGRISGVLTTAAAATSKGDLVFETSAVGTLSESMRLVSGGNVWFEGATDNTSEVIFSFTDPTADRTVTFPDADVDLGGVIPITGTTSDTFTVNSDNTAAVVATLQLGGGAGASGKIATTVGNLTIDSAGGTIDIDDATLDLSTQAVAVTLNASDNALNFDSGTLRIDASSDNVGIGVSAAPSAKLEVDGTLKIVTTSESTFYSSSTGPYLYIQPVDSGTITDYTRIGGYHATPATTNLVFQPAGGNIGIGGVFDGTIAPSYLLSITGQSANTIGMERHQTAATAGNNLTVNAGGAVSGGTNLNGGSLNLASGTATGNGSGSVVIQAVRASQGTGTTDRAVSTMATFGNTACLLLPAGTTSANSAPLKFTSGTSMTAAEAGAMEFDGTNLYITDSTPTRQTLAYIAGSALSSTSSTDFKIGSASTASTTDISLTFGNTNPETITFTGAGTDNFAFSDAIEAEGMTLTGALAANAGITFDNATDTVGAFTSAGTINMNTNILENIGNTGTDFVAATGALNLAGDLTMATAAALYFGDNNQVIYLSGDDLVFLEKEGNWMRFSTNAGEFHFFGDGITMSDDLMSLQADGDLRVKKNFLLPDGGEIKKDDDDNHRIKFDQSSDQMEFYEYGTFDWYYALPDPDVMTMRLSGTAGLTVTNDDANASSASDILTLTHTTTGVPANGIGTGLTFDVEDGTLSSEEQGSIDVIMDDVTSTAEDSTMTFGIRKDGSAVTEIMRLDGTANRVGIGVSGDPGAKLEVNPNSTDGMGLQIDQDDVDQTALDIDTANTSGDIINLDWAGATTQAGAISGLNLDFTNLTSVAGSTTYGIIINDLAAQTTSTEYGIYQEGTNWDYGIYAADNCWFNSDIEVNNWIKVHGYINFETTNSVIGMWDTGIVNFGNTYGSGTGGVTFNLGTRPNDVFNLNIASVTYNFATLSATGDITLSPTGNDVLPDDAGGVNLGDATYYWNDVSYKTLTDRGCLGWFDKGVELQDGRIVSDIEALKSIQPHPTKLTVYGIPMLDYQSMPKVVYKPAAVDGKILPRDENDEPYWQTEENGQKVIKPAQDGAETTALISIMIGAIKELDTQNQALRERVAQLESKLKNGL